MEIIVRPTTVEDAAALVEIYSQPKAQRETLQLPSLRSRCGWKDCQTYLMVFIAMSLKLMVKSSEILAFTTLYVQERCTRHRLASEYMIVSTDSVLVAN